MKKTKAVLPIIVLSQFFCTSLWFAGNGVVEDLIIHFELGEGMTGYLTSSVQFGFIIGTLLFAILSIADRYSPSKVFFVCSLLGAAFNMGIIIDENTMASTLMFRFFTGFFLAGIYPVGMKIAADYYQKGLGLSLGFLVGALVVGTAFPHLLKDLKGDLPWQFVLISTSVLASIGGILMLALIPDGPYRKPSPKFKLTAIFEVFKTPDFRSAAFGYFGHMWELYAFWSFVPILLFMYEDHHQSINLNIPLVSFFVIAIGGAACIMGGYISLKSGVRKTAFIALLLSCSCCLVSPIIFTIDSPLLFLFFLLFWGMVVIADSPLFSSLVAHHAPVELKGTALTIVNCVGFFLTILSIQLINHLYVSYHTPYILTILAIGPILGLLSLLKIRSKS
ncbi:MAG: MFS transporter [Bacteroidota bacterium]